MICPRCGTEIKEGEKFCKGCGNQIVSQNNINNNQINNVNENINQINNNAQQINNQQIYNNQMNIDNNSKNKKIRFNIPILFFIAGIILKVISLTIENLGGIIEISSLLNIIGTLLWILSIILVPVVIINKTSDDKSSYVKIDNSIITDEDLIKIFIGRNYEKIMKKKFSFSALFLGYIYTLYRKIYVPSIIFLVLMGLLSELNISIICFLVQVVLGFKFNKWYVDYAKKQVDKLIATNASHEELVNLCQKKGGTNIWITILILILYSIIFIY